MKSPARFNGNGWKGGAATAKVLIRRLIPTGTDRKFDDLLKEMRSAAVKRPGYISGETLRRVDIPGEVLVISTWRTVQDWEEWLHSPEKMEIQAEIDVLLGTPTEYAVYDHA